MAGQIPRHEIIGLLDSLDCSVADMLPRPNDPAAGTRAAEAVRTFAGAIGELESYLKQLQELKPVPQSLEASQQAELQELQTELQEKDRLIAHARAQIARWQDVVQQQEQLQESTLFAGLGS